MAILIDLDQTLINSQLAESQRRARNWQSVYQMIPSLLPYPGMTELLADLKIAGLPICIVTSSPQPYCDRVVTRWGWNIDATVCYHDTSNKKPHPEPILLALKKLNVEAKSAISIGDAAKDTRSAKSAGVFSIGAMWGTLEREQLLQSKPDLLCETIEDLRRTLFQKFEVS
ncbi:HAD family hydrolase [Leptolyngbya sp. FACHB-17]|uniref:HAD family hydrolase n=1 Tax=unclassified Leptolyngbya TaxID=2650499 RepID=UPI0016808955|nr:HAD family hydrolase [Leptolyngbya sp. FACHB-17]MBD2078455.1 HAD family hydrolase [Leptolyngbya sp. FACHB-17]